MRLQTFLFLLYLFIFSDIIAAGIGGWHLSGLQNRIAKAFAVVLLTLCLEGILHLVANGFGYVVKPQYTTGFAWSFWTGRAIRSVALWYFVLYLFKVKKYRWRG